MSSELQRYVDPAMFKAEPLKASDGPKVYLLWMTPDPLGAMAAMAKMYRGEVVRDMARDVTDEDRRATLKAMGDTKLKAPMEAVKLHFMVENVTRSFTHQMVRQRTAAYAQESLRFAVKEDMAEGVALPPSLMGTEPQPPEHDSMYLTDAERMRVIWDDAVQYMGGAYNQLINMGMPAEDARGLLPHNITTRLNYVTDLRALQDHGGNRLCTQAQFEWRVVFTQIANAIRTYKEREGDRYFAWQYEAIADLFRPACYLTGKCEFAAQGFDRKCKIRARVDANHDAGRPSTEWAEEMDRVEGNPIVSGVGPKSVIREGDEGSRPVFIGAIHPAEWLADPAAAR